MKPPCFKHSRSRILPTDPRILHLPFLLVITAAYLVALFWFHHMRFTRPTSLTSPEGPSRPQSPWARGRCSPPTGWGCQCQWRACGAPPSCTTTPRAGLPGRRAALLFVPPPVPPQPNCQKIPGKSPQRGPPRGLKQKPDWKDLSLPAQHCRLPDVDPCALQPRGLGRGSGGEVLSRI